MKAIIASTLFASAAHLSAAVYLVDFNTTNTGNYPGGASAWNIYADDEDIEGTPATLADTLGSSAAGITLLATGTHTDSSNGATNGFDNATGGPSWVTSDGSLSNTGAAGDYFWTNNGSGVNASQASFTLTLGNLITGDSVSLDLWFSRSGSAPSGFYEYSLDNGSTWSGFDVLEKSGTLATADGWSGTDTSQTGQAFQGERDGNNNARYMNIEGLTVGASGTLQIRVTDVNANDGVWTGLSAFRLTTVPEPSLAAFSLLAIAGFALRRQR